MVKKSNCIPVGGTVVVVGSTVVGEVAVVSTGVVASQTISKRKEIEKDTDLNANSNIKSIQPIFSRLIHMAECTNLQR